MVGSHFQVEGQTAQKGNVYLRKSLQSLFSEGTVGPSATVFLALLTHCTKNTVKINSAVLEKQPWVSTLEVSGTVTGHWPQKGRQVPGVK